MPMRIKTRRPDPPRQSQLATLRAASRRESAREEIVRKLAKLSELAALAKSMVAPSAPPPPRTPKPPPPPPQAFGPPIDATTSPATRRAILAAQANVAAGSSPCLLTAEQLASSMPSEWTLRCWRRAQEKFEAEEQKAQKPDQLSQLMFFRLLIN
jgi:hypothetical protein